MTPIDTLLAWFNALPIEVREELARLFSGSVPEPLISMEDAVEYDHSRFGELVNRWGETNPSKRPLTSGGHRPC